MKIGAAWQGESGVSVTLDYKAMVALVSTFGLNGKDMKVRFYPNKNKKSDKSPDFLLFIKGLRAEYDQNGNITKVKSAVESEAKDEKVPF